MPNTTFRSVSTLLLITLFAFQILPAQTEGPDKLATAAHGLQLRGIGPAFMGGRIADIAVSTADRSTWYVAVGSGGLWKTTNSGITWRPIFDEQPSYSIGTVSIDPNNPEVVWVGTGENVSGRHVGWGDGIYLSRNGGTSWQRMGLERSEHIGKILVDPRNSDVVFVAAEGPLWASGGDRGLYKTADGGKTWQLVLEIDENTGVTDVEFDPSDPDVLYAAAYQRRRQTWSLLAGGPQSGIYKSIDNGATWKECTTGLPKGDMGKIGLAVTPADPNIVYATIEADGNEKGFYRSMDKGESWEKRNGYISGGTGPHYYQEIEASTVDPDLIYQMDVFLNVSRDGGKSFGYLETGRGKHSDNHALWIDDENGKHMLVGTDGGLYESFDEGFTWRHFPNLPISQFYKLSLDNSEPFYNVVGGAQDLGTLMGPSRTMNIEGVRNQDWYVPLGADGYDNAFDPQDPNIVYMEIQEGNLHRYDRRTEEGMDIQPQPEPNDPPERWNWDSPILISPHNNARIYYGSQRLWRSGDKGSSWTPISGDLTTNTNRYELKTIDRVWSVDALYDNGAMSKFSTLTAISESPLAEGLLYVGSDDGLIQISEDGGDNWRKGTALPKLPALSFINDVEASAHDANTVFVAADAHKFGDFTPYLFMSSDRGRSWKSIAGDLPKGNLVWSIKQDFKVADLLFIGTETGIYFSPNKGINWIKLDGGVPTIPFRDLELHPRDHDLVGASFGRGVYVLDDYTPLRELAKVVKADTNTLFSVRDAWWYLPNTPMQAKGMPSQGTTSFVSKNPPFGALFTYYLANLPQLAKAEREEAESALREKNASIPFPGWDRLQEEAAEADPKAMLLVRNGNGEAIRWIEGAGRKGLHRINWDLRISPPDPIELEEPAFKPPWAGDPEGPLAAPGTYNVELFVLHNGTLRSQGAPREFLVKPAPNMMDGTDLNAVAQFQHKTSALWGSVSGASEKIQEIGDNLRHIKAALLQTPKASHGLFERFGSLEKKLTDLRMRLRGGSVLDKMNEATSPSIMSRVGQVAGGHWNTRQAPTGTQQRNLEIAERDFALFRQDFANYINELSQYETELESAGAPWTPGRKFGLE
ncbi:MAG: glycosyl hydrolase [Sediminicola sp.]